MSEAMKLRQANRAIDARPSVAGRDVSEDTMVVSLAPFRVSHLAATSGPRA